MGKLKEHCLSVLEDRGDEVLEHYDRFLIFAWKNREMPSGYRNAINYICKRTGLGAMEVNYILEQRIDSLYEGY